MGTPTFDPTKPFQVFDPTKGFTLETSAKTAPAEEKTWLGAVGDLFSGVWSSLNPLPAFKMLGEAPKTGTEVAASAAGPLALAAVRMAPGMTTLATQAKQAFASGDTEGGLKNALSLVGLGALMDLVKSEPEASSWGDVIKKKAHPLGEVLGAIGPMLLGGGEVPAAAKLSKIGQAAERLAVPLSAAEATGNPLVRALEFVGDRGLVGENVVAPAARARQLDALEQAATHLSNQSFPAAISPEAAGSAVQGALEARAARDAAARASAGNRLASRVSPSPVTAVQAGEAIQVGAQSGASAEAAARSAQAAALQSRLPTGATLESSGQAILDKLKQAALTAHDDASVQYGAVRDIEASHTRPVVTGRTRVESPVLGPDGKPVVHYRDITADVGIPLDVGAAKAGLSDLMTELDQAHELGTLHGARANAYFTLKKFMAGPNVASLSEVDSALSDLKSLSRMGGKQVTRTAAQGIAAKAVESLEQVVKTTLADHPDLEAALTAGREATKRKYSIQATLSALSQEPVRAVKALAASGDAGIARLREVQGIAPDVMPLVGSAYLRDMVGATKASALSSWERLGPETRRALFSTDATIQDIDRYLRAPDGPATALVQQLADEPARVFSSATYAGDAGIDRLREIGRVAPGALPLVGRALLDNILAMPAEAASRAWATIGEQTKSLLYPRQGLARAIEAYVKPSPTGSAADLVEKAAGKTPVQLFDQLTAAGDTQVPKLRAIARIAPTEIPKVARAVMDGLVERVWQGDMAGASRGWAKLGDSTKAILLPQSQLVPAWDDFFAVASSLQKSPDAARRTVLGLTQGGLVWADPWAGLSTQIGLAGLSTLLHSEAGVRLLTRGFQIPAKNTVAASLWANQVAKAAGLNEVKE